MTKVFASLFFGASLMILACGPNQRIINSAQENRDASSVSQGSNIAPAENSFERDLNAMRNADFNFIYVFRRRDGGVLDSGDKSFITSTSTAQMNRRTVADGGKAVIIGSNFRMPAEALDAIKQRFAFEDYSKPDVQQTER